MKLLHYLIAGMVSTGALTTQASETAKATIFCYSLRFERGIDPDGNYFLNLGSSTAGTDGELALDFFSSGYTHSAYVSLTDELFGDTVSGQLGIDVPDGGDANQDGFPDFFQVNQGITNLASAGADHLPNYGNGAVTATWSRNAGSKDGLCLLSIKLLPAQPVVFNLPFEILEYKGPLTYTPGTNKVNATLNLLQTGNSSAFMTGPAEFFKSSSNRFNELTLQTGVWTNESEQALTYVQHLISRDQAWPTNYYGYFEFDDDNNPNTFYPYGLWMVSIDDLNDSNHNGIPDFSDDPGSGVLPRQPRLELSQTSTNVLLTIHGDLGYTHEIQQLTDLASTNWQTTTSVTLTNDPQTVSLPIPPSGSSFWRVTAR